MDLAGRRVAVVGLGMSNVALIRYLVGKGAQVTACDQQSAEALGDRYREAASLGVAFSLGPGYLDVLSDFDLIYLTPGIAKHLPPIAAAAARGAVLSGEIDLVLSLLRAPVVGVTGSAGKTTTTTLIGEMGRAAGLDVRVGGNIGRPLILEAEGIPAATTVVLELSSFQLHLARRSPHIAVVTNITPNHLDVHASMAEYVAAKGNILRFQASADYAVLNYDDETVRAMAALTAGRVVWFSLRGAPPLSEGDACYLADDRLIWRFAGHEYPVALSREVLIPGRHNLANACAAAAAAFLAGAGHATVRQVLTSFRGVEHRLEPVRELDGVEYYNDSKATSPAEMLAALETLTRPLVLIAGGYDKKLPFDSVGAAIARRAHTLLLTGPTAPAIAAAVQAAIATDPALGPGPAVLVVSGMEAAVAAAQAAARPGDAVLLSPACASYDAYHNFEERGRHFKSLVQALQ